MGGGGRGGGVDSNRLTGTYYNKVLVLMIRLTSKYNHKKDETAFFMHTNNNINTRTIHLLTTDKVYSIVYPTNRFG